MFTASTRNRLLLLLAVLVCYALFWWAGRIFGIPVYPGHAVSLMLQPSPAAAILVTMVVLIVCVLLGTLIAGTVRFDAGLFAAAAGLMALSFHGGPMREVLLAATSPAVYLLMLFELLMLYGIIGLAWSALWLLHRNGWLQGDAFRDGVEDVEDPLDQKCLALVTQAVVMIMAMLLLAHSDQKAQALAAVGISSFLGAIASHYLFAVRPSVWFWAGPLIVGALGYLLGYFNPGNWIIGAAAGPLARPLPIDYASIGPAAAILGYWMSRRWQRMRETAEESSSGESVGA